jgi:hypothetical protein
MGSLNLVADDSTFAAAASAPKPISTMRRVAFYVGLVFFLFAIFQRVPLVAQDKPSRETLAPPQLRLEIRADNWGSASRDDILAVCASAGRELTSFFPGRQLEPITVGQTNGGSPITLFKRSADGRIRMLLDTRDTFWAQFAYQFGHELCHVLCNYREADNPQLWFEESLCETASLFVLRRMADTWKTDPPYANWKSFAPAFDNYVDDRISNTEKLDNKSLAEWYRDHRVELEKDPTNRTLNQVVAVKVLLPLLQKKPQHWQALDYLNQWDPKQRPTFQQYLQDWHDRVPAEQRPFVAAIAERFEIELTPPPGR